MKSIYDGDTMTVYYEEDGEQQEARVRFLLIDTSEKGPLKSQWPLEVVEKDIF